MEQWQCCRTCLGVNNLNLIFPVPEYKEKYSEVIFAATGVKIEMNDSYTQTICSACINFINQSYKFRKKCEVAQKTLSERHNQNTMYEIEIETNVIESNVIYKSENIENNVAIDISDLLIDNVVDNDFRDYDDNITLSEYSTEICKNNDNNCIKIETNIPHVVDQTFDEVFNKQGNKNTAKTERKKPEKKRGRTKKENQEEKRTKEKKERVREQIECELCHKVLTSKLSLRNHYKIHTGFDVVCEHCGKKFITRRLLLMHCKAKHGYEKTDKCSFCDYKASNAEQVKIHERLHTGEKPYVCAQCGAGFHRKSSYLQHVAIHLPEKTVQCDQCPARFKSVTLMRIHKNRHRAPRYTYKCRVCDNSFARRRNVARHLLRIHAIQPQSEHIDRTKYVGHLHLRGTYDSAGHLNPGSKNVVP